MVLVDLADHHQAASADQAAPVALALAAVPTMVFALIRLVAALAAVAALHPAVVLVVFYCCCLFVCSFVFLKIK